MSAVTARLRRLVAERLRDRLGVHDDARLPRIPAEGVVAPDVVLRRYRPEDADSRLRLESSPGLDRWDARCRSATTRAEFDAWLAEQQRRYAAARGPCSLAVCAPGAPDLLGDLTFWRLRDRWNSVELGVAMLPDARNLRWVLATGAAVVPWLHAQGVQRVEAHHVVGHDAACFVARAGGLAVEGVLRGVFPQHAGDGTTRWLDACAHASVAP
ncbi:GNAT family N-acetyltransferase [Isoptericola sp. BMS4]|uniref:GNAT family N-acetyltransferase n=1 Tax=Isoptericola sp. BMS4 TaxID=2527875 RepID=UPI0014207B4C|nr:GNAT family N-acetyltransferase [Isoptericola sp. BMS4]